MYLIDLPPLRETSTSSHYHSQCEEGAFLAPELVTSAIPRHLPASVTTNATATSNTQPFDESLQTIMQFSQEGVPENASNLEAGSSNSPGQQINNDRNDSNISHDAGHSERSSHIRGRVIGSDDSL